ncbi:hypothetical protein ACEYW6_34795 [Nostoc sp. UIC 10607]
MKQLTASIPIAVLRELLRLGANNNCWQERFLKRLSFEMVDTSEEI